MSGDFETLRDSGSSDDNQLVRLLEEKIKSLQIEIENLRKELNYYKAEMDKMLSPPLIEAMVLDVLPDGRILVRSSSGPNLIVNVASHIDQSLIKPGRSVALNQRGSTILEVLPQKEDPI
ncbi:MAG: proteasome-activating nucleotidase, partial [Saccharolobus sp.]